jgi:AraC-like DNA-binding protein
MGMQRDPVREWREQYTRCCDFEPIADEPFQHSLKPIFDQPRVVRAALSPGFLFRDDDLVRDGDNGVSLVIAQSVKLDIMHRGREVQLGPGEAIAMQADAPGRCGSRKDFVIYELMVLRAEWEIRGSRPGDALMQRIGRNSDALELLRSYIRSLERSAFATSGEAREIVRRHLIDLVVLAATPHPSVGESSASAVVAARLNAALDHIATHVENPELSLEAVAVSQGISPRYLQHLMELSGASFTAHVNELRLQRAFRLLIEPHGCSKRISDVALDAGFSDISHFNRLFRSRFGDTPKGVRANHQTVSYAN